MINWFCGFLCGSGTTLLLYSLLVGKRIQEEQDKACKCIYKYEEYRRKIRTIEYQKRELEKKLESSKYSGDYLGFEETK
jgi:hypothetical protein